MLLLLLSVMRPVTMGWRWKLQTSLADMDGEGTELEGFDNQVLSTRISIGAALQWVDVDMDSDRTPSISMR